MSDILRYAIFVNEFSYSLTGEEKVYETLAPINSEMEKITRISRGPIELGDFTKVDYIIY